MLSMPESIDKIDTLDLAPKFKNTIRKKFESEAFIYRTIYHNML